MNKLHSRFLPLLAVALFAISACRGDKNDAQDSSADVEQAPNFEVTTVFGETISLKESLTNDKPVVIYFTASWCPICAQNWPVLSELYPEYEDRLTIVAIGIDPTDDDKTMQELAEEEGFTFPVTRGLPDIMLEYGVDSQATTVGVNRDGEIAFRKNKMALSEEDYRKLFDQLAE